MDILSEIEKRLMKYPHVKFSREANGLTIRSPNDNGFDISLFVTDCYEVNFEGWHEEFKEPEEALDCIAFGLSAECRLRVFRRGEMDYKWTLESKSDSGWQEESTTGLIFYPFWRQASQRFLQNALVA